MLVNQHVITDIKVGDTVFPVTTQKLSWHQRRSPHTTAYENHVLLQLVGSTVGDVSVREQLGYEAVMGIIGRRIDTRVRWAEIGRIDTIGTDDISLGKGHRNFVTVVTALTDGELMMLAVLPDRERKTVRRESRIYYRTGILCA